MARTTAKKTTTKKATSKKSPATKAESGRGSGKKKSAKGESGGGGLLGKILLFCWLSLLAASSCTVASLPSDAQIRGLNASFPQTTSLMAIRQAQARQNGQAFDLAHTPVNLEEISPFVVNALVASEDARFFSHEGVDWRQMEAAVKESARTKSRLRGASTLTQQLAKNLYLSERRSPIRKLKELWITQKLEENVSKERLLAVYLNSVEWGDGIFGIQEAARIWFGKTASTVTLGEAAALVAMLPNPRRIGPTANDEWRQRTARVLKRLTAEGKVTKAEAQRASHELDAMVF